MNLPGKPHFPRWICIFLIMMVLLSCNFLTNLVSNPFPSTPSNQAGSEAPGVAGQPPVGSEQPTAEPDPLDHLLAMRSIIIHLTALQSDGSSSSTQIEIDSAGNMHVKYSLPAMDPKLLPQGFDATQLPTSNELLVVDGKAYQPSDQDPNWMSTPMDENYIQTLSQDLHGPDGVAPWLDILPDGSLISAGQETVGGFETNKFTVNGAVEGGAITGSLWYEPQANALVKAELHVPAAIYDVTDKSPTGELKITLDTQKADVPMVTLPSAPAATAEPSATP